MSIDTIREGIHGANLVHKGNGVASHLDTLFSTFDQRGVVLGSVPLLQMRPPLGVSLVDYAATQRFMDKVVAAGLDEGRRLFISGHPAFGEFYAARESGKAVDMLLDTPFPLGVDSVIWGERVGNTEAARSVVNRKALVQAILTAHGSDLLKTDPYRRQSLLSIASGYGRSPIDVMGGIDSFQDSVVGGKASIPSRNRIRGFLVDTDPLAIEASKRLASERGLRERMDLWETSVWRLFADLQKPQRGRNELIESTGFTDYLKDRMVTHLLRACHDLVTADGIVVITNIVSDREDPYLKIVWEQGKLRMYRRTPEDLVALAERANFEPEKITLIMDSTDTMCTVVARP